jgi:exonuclease V gamma subunit
MLQHLATNSPKSENQIYTESKITDIFIQYRIYRQWLNTETTQISEDGHPSPKNSFKREGKINIPISRKKFT